MPLAEEMFRITPLDLEVKHIVSHHFLPHVEKQLLMFVRTVLDILYYPAPDPDPPKPTPDPSTRP